MSGAVRMLAGAPRRQTIALGFCGAMLLAAPLWAAEPQPADQTPAAAGAQPAPSPESSTISASPAPSSAEAAPGTRGIHPEVRIARRINRVYDAGHDLIVRDAPSDNAEPIGRVSEGMQVFVAGMVEGGSWLQMRMPDGATTGYVRAADVPAVLGQLPPQPTAAPPAAETPAPAAEAPAPGTPATEAVITGHPTVVDTATLTVDGRLVSLYGVAGLDGEAAAELQQYIDANGGSVTCHPQGGNEHVCQLPNNTDVAMAALINGAALLGPGAPDTYVAERNEAVRNHRGTWGNCALPAFTPPAGLPPELLQAYMARLSVNPLVEVEALGDGGWLVDGVPYAFVDGAFRGIAFEAGRGGWGFRDREGRWRDAPERLRADLDRKHPRGEGLRHEAGIRTEGERGREGRAFGERGREGHEAGERGRIGGEAGERGGREAGERGRLGGEAGERGERGGRGGLRAHEGGREAGLHGEGRFGGMHEGGGSRAGGFGGHGFMQPHAAAPFHAMGGHALGGFGGGHMSAPHGGGGGGGKRH